MKNNITEIIKYSTYEPNVLTEIQMICWFFIQLLTLMFRPVPVRNERIQVSNTIVFLSILIYYVFITINFKIFDNINLFLRNLVIRTL